MDVAESVLCGIMAELREYVSDVAEVPECIKSKRNRVFVGALCTEKGWLKK